MSFNRFKHIFKPDKEHQQIDGSLFGLNVEKTFGIALPQGITNLWSDVGTGYFNDGEFFLFPESCDFHPGLIRWNESDFFGSIFKSPKDGGPLFFAENCFGEQLGFRKEGNNFVFVLFVVDTFDLFIVAHSFKELMEGVLTERDAITDLPRLEKIRARLGRQKNGWHYAPIVSPLIGGSGDPNNFDVVTPNIHFRTAIATFEAIQELPKNSAISRLDVKLQD